SLVGEVLDECNVVAVDGSVLNLAVRELRLHSAGQLVAFDLERVGVVLNANLGIEGSSPRTCNVGCQHDCRNNENCNAPIYDLISHHVSSYNASAATGAADSFSELQT